MIKLESIDDVYRLDYEMSTPGVRDGLLANAEKGGEDYEIIQDEDGFRGVFMRTTAGLYPLGSLAPVQLAAAPTETMTDAMPQGATVPQGPEIKAYDPTTREQISAFLQSGLEGVGVDRARARKISQSLIGGPSSNLPLSLGIADIVPFLGTALQTEEAVRLGEDAAQLAGQGKYAEAAISATGAAIGMIPGAVGTAQVAKKVAPTFRGSGDALAPVAPEMQAGVVNPSAFMPETKQSPQKSGIGFYSAVEDSVIGLKQDKGTGAQFLAQITKTAGVKPEELKWTGLDEFLKGKKSVSKDEILNYLNTNRVDVQEVRLTGSRKFTNPDESLTYLASRKGMTVDDVIETYGYSDDYDYVVLANMMSSPTKFSRYTLPGGENYREILLTLPETKGPSADEMSRQMFGRRFNQLSPADQEVVRAQARENSSANFRSSHFDQPNILAHMRVNDRVVDGKKTLFIEEIQSDWHQAGRKKGYQRAKDLTPNDVDLRFVQSDVPEGADPSVYPGYYEAFDKQTGEFLGRHSGTLNREQAMRDAVMSANQFQTGVPNAPFKTSWHELSLKRAIQEASEKGYDQIAFTTGKTQAERYDLSQQIDEINVVGRTNAATGERTKSVALDTTDGKSLRFGVNNQGIVDNVSDSSMSNFVGKGLDEVIGKDLAKKIMDGGSQTISGEGLKVGGEGMKGFYDNILPKSLDKLAKKFDAKVGKTFIEGGYTRDADGIPSMRPEKIEVWQMDITPKMRESVTTKGQPLFQVGTGAGAAAGAATTMQDNEERM